MFSGGIKWEHWEQCYNKETRTKLIPAGIYLFKVNNRNTRTRYEICSKLAIKTPEPCQSRQ